MVWLRKKYLPRKIAHTFVKLNVRLHVWTIFHSDKYLVLTREEKAQICRTHSAAIERRIPKMGV